MTNPFKDPKLWNTDWPTDEESKRISRENRSEAMPPPPWREWGDNIVTAYITAASAPGVFLFWLTDRTVSLIERAWRLAKRWWR